VEGKFDFILFNPPYLPGATPNDRTVNGGKGGTKLTRTFLAGLPARLKTNGVGLLLVSSLNDPAFLTNEYQAFNYAVMAKRRLFFEELQVLGVRLREDLARQ
jgi:methylase of polypeptide subunit release factors